MSGDFLRHRVRPESVEPDRAATSTELLLTEIVRRRADIAANGRRSSTIILGGLVAALPSRPAVAEPLDRSQPRPPAVFGPPSPGKPSRTSVVLRLEHLRRPCRHPGPSPPASLHLFRHVSRSAPACAVAIARPGGRQLVTMSAATADIEALTAAHVPDDWSDVDTRAVDTARVLAADAVQKVGNGHPGTAMSLAPLAYSLFQKVMRHDPADPTWVGRDRFVLSCGHSSSDPVHPAVPGRVRVGAGRSGGAADLGVADPRASGVPPHQGCGDDDRAAGSGAGLRGRDGDGVPPGARPVRPGRSAG